MYHDLTVWYEVLILPTNFMSGDWSLEDDVGEQRSAKQNQERSK